MSTFFSCLPVFATMLYTDLKIRSLINIQLKTKSFTFFLLKTQITVRLSAFLDTQIELA